MLEEFNGTNEETDRLWWKLDSKGIFKVNSAYKFLNQGNQQTTLAMEAYMVGKDPLQSCLRYLVTGKRGCFDSIESQEEEILSMFQMLPLW